MCACVRGGGRDSCTAPRKPLSCGPTIVLDDREFYKAVLLETLLLERILLETLLLEALLLETILLETLPFLPETLLLETLLLETLLLETILLETNSLGTQFSWKQDSGWRSQVANRWRYMVVLHDDVAVPRDFRQNVCRVIESEFGQKRRPADRPDLWDRPVRPLSGV